MIALGRVERLTGQHGEWIPDATSDRADPNNYDHPLRYVPGGPYTNWAEKAVKDAEVAYRKAGGENVNMNGLFWTVDPQD